MESHLSSLLILPVVRRNEPSADEKDGETDGETESEND